MSQGLSNIVYTSDSITSHQGGSWSVTVGSALPAGTNAIGKLAANDGVDIGDVTINNTSLTVVQATAASLNATVVGTGTFAVQATSVPTDPFGANADAASATGSISAKLRFIASTGIPVTGTVTVGSHAVTNIGTFAVQVDGAALTSLQLLDDVVYAEDTASADLDKGVLIMARRTATPAVTSGTDGDYEPIQTSKGRLWVEPSSPVIAAGQVSVTNTSATLVAARAGRQSITVVNHGTTDVYLGAGTVTTSNGLLLVGIKGAAVTLQTSAAINCIVASGTQTVSYIEEYTS